MGFSQWVTQDVPAALKSLFKRGSTTPPMPASHNSSSPTQNPMLMREIVQSSNYYRGEYNKPFIIRPGEPDDNVLINHAATIVDKGVAFLIGNQVSFEVDSGKKGKTTGDTEQSDPVIDAMNQYLADVWENNRKMTLLTTVATNGGVKGHTYIKIVPVPGKPFPRLIALDPALVTPLAQADDCSVRTGYVIEFNTIEGGKSVMHRETHNRDDNELFWTIRVEHKLDTEREWTLDSDIEWPYPFPQIADCQNRLNPNQILGLSDLTKDVRHINDVINRNLSNSNKIIRFHAHPKTWGRGFGGTSLGDWGPDQVIELPSEKAELQNLEMKSDLSAAREFVVGLEDNLYQIARIPPIAMAKMVNLGSLSGVALSILYRPMVEKTDQKRMLYGDMLSDVNCRLLVMSGFISDTSDVNVLITWPNYIPLVLADALGLKQLGVSKGTLIEEFGYDAEHEAEQSKQESEDAMALPQAATPAGETAPPQPSETPTAAN